MTSKETRATRVRPVSSLKDDIAKITLNLETEQIDGMVFFRKDLRFRCKRCAVFCCNLGGPRVTGKDRARLEPAGHQPVDFLDSAADEETQKERWKGIVLKKSRDGSCIFLENDGESRSYRCRVYELRPALCRLYPFEFEVIGPNEVLLKFIPCCNGLNARNGSFVDRRFVEEQLLEAILDLLQC